jgi:hypothetical protein
MALTVPPIVISSPPVAGYLIIGALLLYGGNALYRDVRGVLGFQEPGDDGPLVTLPLGLIALGVGLALVAIRR